MTTRRGAVLGSVLGLALLVLLSGCGGSQPSTRPSTALSSGSPSTAGTSPAISPGASPSLSPSTTAPVRPLAPTVTVGGTLAVGVPHGWVVQRSAVQSGSGSVCLFPAGSTDVIFGCAGVAFFFGPRLPGAHAGPYAADRPDGWYSTRDRQPCPFGDHALTDTRVPRIVRSPGFDSGLRPVGTHRASWNRWTASCVGRTFHPQAWYLPSSSVVAFDYLDHPETASILASVVFARDGATLPPSPTYLSAHVLSGTAARLVVQPFHTYTNDAAGKAYAAAHGLGYPFLDDYADADVGPRRTIVLDARTACVGGLDLGKDLTGVPVPCSAFGEQGQRMPAGIWLRPGSSTAESVTEIFRP